MYYCERKRKVETGEEARSQVDNGGARCGMVHVHLRLLTVVLPVSQSGATTKYCPVHLSAQGGTLWHVCN